MQRAADRAHYSSPNIAFLPSPQLDFYNKIFSSLNNLYACSNTDAYSPAY